jgi:hypothetical protein
MLLCRSAMKRLAFVSQLEPERQIVKRRVERLGL